MRKTIFFAVLIVLAVILSPRLVSASDSVPAAYWSLDDGSARGADSYLILHFQYHPNDSVLAWANTTIGNYPSRRVIVTTHDYMNVDGSRTTEGNHI